MRLGLTAIALVLLGCGSRQLGIGTTSSGSESESDGSESSSGAATTLTTDGYIPDPDVPRSGVG
jgi:hypothetical protein